MRCVVLEILRGVEINPPAGSRLAQTPAGARVKITFPALQNLSFLLDQEMSTLLSFSPFFGGEGTWHLAFMPEVSTSWLIFQPPPPQKKKHDWIRQC